MSAPDAVPSSPSDPVLLLDEERLAVFSSLADRLIPAAHGMPSAAEIVDEARIRFVLTARPDLIDPLREALRPELGGDAAARLKALEGDEDDNLAALLLVLVGGYYTDPGVRELIGYPGQLAKQIYSWKYPDFMEEGLLDPVLARGPIWRDPATGRTAEPSPSEAAISAATAATWPTPADAAPQP